MKIEMQHPRPLPSFLFIVSTIAISFFLKPSLSSACSMSKSEKSDIFINSELQILHYGNRTKSDGPIAVDITKCNKDGGKFLLFAIGSKSPSLYSDVEHISYDGKYIPAKCQAQNSQLNTGFIEQLTSQKLTTNHDFARRCLVLKLRDVNREPIQFDPNQKNCKVRNQTSGTLSLEGDYCYTRVNPRGHLQLAVEVKPDCLKSDYLRFHKIQAGDYDFVVNTWVSGDQSGLTTDVEYVRSIPVKVSVLASSKVLSLTENFSKPEISFPTTYNTEIHPGTLSLQNVGNDRYNLDLSLEVKNLSPTKCQPGLPCSSPSQFRMPVAGEITFAELNNQQEDILQSSPFIAIVPPQYQGLLKNGFMPTLENKDIKPNKAYRVRFTMLDPAEDFHLALRKIAAIKFNLPTPNETLDGFQNTPILGDTKDLAQMSSLPTSMTRGAVDLAIDELNRILRDGRSSIIWPQRYENICFPINGETKKCESLDRLSQVITIEIDFLTGQIDPATNQIQLRNVISRRQTGLSPSLETSKNGLSRFECAP